MEKVKSFVGGIGFWAAFMAFMIFVTDLMEKISGPFWTWVFSIGVALYFFSKIPAKRE